MTKIETGESRHRVCFGAKNTVNSSSELRVEADRGGLVIIGPSAGEIPGIETLLAMPGVEAVEAIGTQMMSWKTVSAEVVEVGRSVSRLIRNGQTAVVHLDSHIGEAPAIPVDGREFVCARLGQIMIGVADVPAYVVTHSERMARSLIVDSLADQDAESVGSIGAGCPVWRLSAGTMFPGVCVTMCPGDRPADAMVELLAWFEARRN